MSLRPLSHVPRPRPTLLRRLVTVLAMFALVLAPTAGTILATPAHAEDGYRYWSYYQRADDGSWAYASSAPSSTPAEDGSVQGWRFAVGGMSSVRPPRATVTFDDVCSKVLPVDGQVRVAVVIDPGTPEDAPQGDTPGGVTATCVVAPQGSTALQALQLITDVRTDDSGLICGVAGYPSTGCGDPVADISVPASDAPVGLTMGDPAGNVASSASTPVWVWVVVGAVVVLLLGGGVLVGRRRRSA